MEKAEGILVENKGELSKVKIVRGSMCGESCGSCNLCGKRETFVFARNKAGAVKGDRVVLEMDSASGLKAAFLVYGMPLVILILGIVLIAVFNSDQIKGLLLVLFAIVLWFFVVKLIDKNMKPAAEITEVVCKNDTE